jgi:hypothetical protein
MLRTLEKLVRLRREDWADLLAAQLAVCRAQLLVWTRRRGALLARESPAVVLPVPPASTALPPRDVLRLALAVSRAAQYGLFRPTCLVRSVALQQLLARRGFPDSALRVGIRRENGRLRAHAWVEYAGTVLGDDAWLAGQFAALARLRMSQAS